MFGAKYSRKTFWIWSIILLILSLPGSSLSQAPAGDIKTDPGTVLILVILPSVMWINTLANRIRDYGSNPWLSLWALIPIVNIGMGFYYGIVQYSRER